MPITLGDVREHWWRLKATDEDEIFDVFGANLLPATKDAILTDLEAPLEAAKEAWRDEHRDAIRDYALKLPVDDPLRVAIEGCHNDS